MEEVWSLRGTGRSIKLEDSLALEVSDLKH